MTSVKSNTIIFISSIFIFLFVYTALSKFQEFSKFIHVLGQSPLVGNYSHLVAWTIPLLELGVAGMLLIPSTKRLGVYVTFFLMVLFTAYVGYMIAFVPHLPCSCGGVIQKMSWKQHLIFNIILTGISFWGTRLLKNQNINHGTEKRVVFT